jgi:hypothetical protein
MAGREDAIRPARDSAQRRRIDLKVCAGDDPVATFSETAVPNLRGRWHVQQGQPRQRGVL